LLAITERENEMEGRFWMVEERGRYNGLMSTTFFQYQQSREIREVRKLTILNLIVGESGAVFELLVIEDQTLAIQRYAFLVLDRSLNILDGVGSLDLESDSLASKSLNEDLHTAVKKYNQVKDGFILDVVVRKSSVILELFVSEDQTLLIKRYAFLVLDRSLNVLDGIGSFYLESDRLASKSVDEDLHLGKSDRRIKVGK